MYLKFVPVKLVLLVICTNTEKAIHTKKEVDMT